MHKCLHFVVLLCLGCGDMAIEELGALSKRSDTQIGNSVEVFPFPPFKNVVAPFPTELGFGEEKTILKVSGNPARLSKNFTIYVQTIAPKVSSPFVVNDNFVAPGPFIGRLIYGSGGGSADVEFNLESPKRFSQLSTGGIVLNSGKSHWRNGLTVISFTASDFDLFVRNDSRAPTINGVAAFNQIGTDAITVTTPVGPGVPVALSSDVGTRINAWVGYDSRPTGSKLFRRLVVSNGVDSQIAPAAFATVPVMPGAKRVRVYRQGATPQPPVLLTVQTDAASTVDFALAVNDTGPVELPIGSQDIILSNGGASALTVVHVEYELNL